MKLIKNKKLRKKAQFFTITIILLMSLYIVSFTYVVYEKHRTRAYNVQTRVDAMNWFIKDAERDMENVLYTSSARATIALVEDVIENNQYIDDVDAAYKELILNGTLDGEENKFLNKTTIINWTEKIKDIASDLDITVEFSKFEIETHQTDPWFIDVQMTTQMYLRDNKNTSWWNRTIISLARFEIDGVLEDPLYIIESNGTIIRVIKKTPFTNFVDYSGPNPDLTNLQDFVQEKQYRHTNTSPSYLQRLEGDFSASECCGIESVISVQEILENPFFQIERSHVDYIYWEDPSNTQTPGTDFWYVDDRESAVEMMIRIDNQSNHIAKYNVSDVIITG